jgi:hypothetical protein
MRVPVQHEQYISQPSYHSSGSNFSASSINKTSSQKIMFNFHFTYLEPWTIYKLGFIIDNAVDPDPDPGFWLPKIVKFYSWQKLFFLLIKSCNFFYSAIKREPPALQNMKLLRLFFGHFCALLDPDPDLADQNQCASLADPDPDPQPQQPGPMYVGVWRLSDRKSLFLTSFYQIKSVGRIVSSFTVIFNGRRLPMYVGRGRSPSHAS